MKPLKPPGIIGRWQIIPILEGLNLLESYTVTLYQTGRWGCSCLPRATESVECVHVRRVRGISDQQTRKFKLANSNQFDPFGKSGKTTKDVGGGPAREITFED